MARTRLFLCRSRSSIRGGFADKIGACELAPNQGKFGQLRYDCLIRPMGRHRTRVAGPKAKGKDIDCAPAWAQSAHCGAGNSLPCVNRKGQRQWHKEIQGISRDQRLRPHIG